MLLRRYVCHVIAHVNVFVCVKAIEDYTYWLYMHE